MDNHCTGLCRRKAGHINSKKAIFPNLVSMESAERDEHAHRNFFYGHSDHVQDIKTSVLYVNGKPSLVTLDYVMDVTGVTRDETDSDISKKGRVEGTTRGNFRLSYFPHRVKVFSELLKESFGEGSVHCVYGDFKPPGVVNDPAFYVHVIQKPS
ncbi:hypothetical protein SK128_027487, partial [Halocaridina rubra]